MTSEAQQTSSSSSSSSSSTSSEKTRKPPHQKNRPAAGKKTKTVAADTDAKPKRSKKRALTTTCPALSKIYTYFPSEDINIWLERFKMAIVLDDVDEDLVSSHLLMNVGPEVFDQLARAKFNKNSPFTEIERFLQKTYHFRDEPFVAQKKLAARKQLQYEDIEVYARELIALASSAYGSHLDLETIKRTITLQFINGLRNRSVRKYILMSEVKDFDTVINQAKKLEALNKQDQDGSDSDNEKRNKNNKNRNRNKDRTNGCFVCGESGHFARDCSDKK